jgi:hypothetical protein
LQFRGLTARRESVRRLEGNLGVRVDREVDREQWLREMGLVGPPERWNWIVEGGVGSYEPGR